MDDMSPWPRKRVRALSDGGDVWALVPRATPGLSRGPFRAAKVVGARGGGRRERTRPGLRVSRLLVVAMFAVPFRAWM